MESLVSALKAGNRRALSKALTLTESTKYEHQELALDLLRRLQLPQAQKEDEPKTTSSTTTMPFFRIGVSGPPGAGKSSLIESLGCSLVQKSHHKVAVIAVDPSSENSGGSILGDKTRMSRLSSLDDAYVRPTPSRGTLGGVARSTSEAITICSAAGYDRILVETVGVGQSEISVKDLVDCMVLVLPPIGGDELQSIKRGITEIADIVVINKADGITRGAAARAAASFRATTHLKRATKRSWNPLVMPVSAHTGDNMDVLMESLEDYYLKMKTSGELDEMREEQYAKVAWTACEEMVRERMRNSSGVKELFQDIKSSGLGPRLIGQRVVEYFLHMYNTKDI